MKPLDALIALAAVAVFAYYIGAPFLKAVTAAVKVTA